MGLVRLRMKHYRESVDCFLSSLDQGYRNPREASQYIGEAVASILGLGDGFLESISGKF